MSTYQHPSLEDLLQVLAAMDSPETIGAFLEDLCTIKEIKDMSQRFATARLLHEGKNYSDISAATGVSTATISRVNRCLHYGSGGYPEAIRIIGPTEK